MNKIIILVIGFVLVMSSIALKLGLTASEKQFVSECQAAWYNITLLVGKIAGET